MAFATNSLFWGSWGFETSAGTAEVGGAKKEARRGEMKVKKYSHGRANVIDMNTDDDV